MANKVHFTGTCPQCGRATKIYSQVEVRLCRRCVIERPKVIPVEQQPLPEGE